MDKDILETYVSQGLSSHKIAKLVNKSQYSVTYWLKKYKLQTKHKSFKNPIKREKTIHNGIEYRICTKCHKEKTVTDFYLKNIGSKYSHTICKSCSKTQTLNWQHELKNKAIQYKGGKCIKCGYNKCINAMDFHHLDSDEKSFGISAKKSRSLENIKSELDKCVLLCANCHREFHAGLFTLNILN